MPGESLSHWTAVCHVPCGGGVWLFTHEEEFPDPICWLRAFNSTKYDARVRRTRPPEMISTRLPGELRGGPDRGHAAEGEQHCKRR